MVGIRWNDWKTMPTRAPAEAGEGVLAQGSESDAVDLDLAPVGTLEPGHDHQQGRLAGAGRPDDADRLPPARLSG